MIGRRKRMLPTLTVTQYRPDHTAAHAYAVSSIHFINAPPCTLPPKLTEVGSARKRKVVSDRSGMKPSPGFGGGARFEEGEVVMGIKGRTPRMSVARWLESHEPAKSPARAHVRLIDT